MTDSGIDPPAAGFSILVMWQARRFPYLVIGWFWYLGTLVPVIGFVQAGAQAYADRYAYVPLIGLFILIAWGIPSLLEGWRFKGLATIVAGCVTVVALSTISAKQVSYWRDNFTLFARALAATKSNWLAWMNLTQ